MWSALPLGDSVYGKEVVGERIRSVVFADGGTEQTQGRLLLHYPRKGSTIPSPAKRPEVKEAIYNIDSLPTEAVRPRPLISTAEVAGVSTNMKAGNGFRLGETWTTTWLRAWSLASLSPSVRSC